MNTHLGVDLGGENGNGPGLSLTAHGGCGCVDALCSWHAGTGKWNIVGFQWSTVHSP